MQYKTLHLLQAQHIDDWLISYPQPLHSGLNKYMAGLFIRDTCFIEIGYLFRRRHSAKGGGFSIMGIFFSTILPIWSLSTMMILEGFSFVSHFIIKPSSNSSSFCCTK
jgi:hypothetical protein